MSFTKEFTVTTTFEDQEYVAVMTRLKRKTAIKLTPFMGEADKNGDVKLTFEDQMKMLDVAGDMIPGHIVSLTRDGESISKDSEEFTNIIEETYYIQLLSELVGELVQNSFVTDVKKN